MRVTMWGSGRRYPLVWLGRLILAWTLLALVTILGRPALGQPAATDLLGTLNLSGYPAGTKPPDFSSRSVEGRTISLAGLRGRIILLNLWATWCVECRPEMPAFEQLHRDFALEGLTVLGINVRGTPARGMPRNWA